MTVKLTKPYCGFAATWIGRTLMNRRKNLLAHQGVVIEFVHRACNRLNAIRLHIDLLGRDENLCTKSRHHLSIVCSEALKLEEAIAELVRCSGIRELAPDPTAVQSERKEA